MPQTVNTNIASLTAQRNLNKSQSQLAVSIQRLSSGLRINSAKDDAAGLAISERFSTQIRGLNQAARNANDGISLAQTAEGSLSGVSDALQRIRELAVQSVNATNSDSDRAALQAEASQLVSEIDRISEQTAFNGVKLLDGSFLNEAFQVGANKGETITVSAIVNSQSSALGTYTAANVTQIAAVAGTGTGTSSGFGTALAAGDVTIADADAVAIDVGAVAADSSAENRASSMRDAINKVSDQTGVYATNDTSTTITLTSAHDVTITLNGTTAHANSTGINDISEAAVSTTGFNSLDISSVGGANTAITAMDAAIDAVNSSRATLGAVQSRFEAVVSNISVVSENLSASRSRIMDADFAMETAALTRTQIMQQAGVAMLSQANSLPQLALSLLQ